MHWSWSHTCTCLTWPLLWTLAHIRTADAVFSADPTSPSDINLILDLGQELFMACPLLPASSNPAFENITRAHWYREEGDVVARDFVLHISQFDDKASGVYFCGYSTPDGHTRRVSRVNMTSSGQAVIRNTTLPVYVYASGGACVLILMALVIVCVRCRRSNRKALLSKSSTEWPLKSMDTVPEDAFLSPTLRPALAPPDRGFSNTPGICVRPPDSPRPSSRPTSRERIRINTHDASKYAYASRQVTDGMDSDQQYDVANVGPRVIGLDGDGYILSRASADVTNFTFLNAGALHGGDDCDDENPQEQEPARIRCDSVDKV